MSHVEIGKRVHTEEAKVGELKCSRVPNYRESNLAFIISKILGNLGVLKFPQL